MRTFDIDIIKLRHGQHDLRQLHVIPSFYNEADLEREGGREVGREGGKERGIRKGWLKGDYIVGRLFKASGGGLVRQV